MRVALLLAWIAALSSSPVTAKLFSGSSPSKLDVPPLGADQLTASGTMVRNQLRAVADNKAR